jgi:membrane protease YdiL (CAAX protease family)
MQFYGFLPRFILGILLGVIYWYSGSLWTAILAHFVYDGVLIIAAHQNPEMLNDEAMAAKATNLALIGLISATMVTAIVLWMKNKSTTTYNEVYADDAIPYKNHPFDFENKQ